MNWLPRILISLSAIALLTFGGLFAMVPVELLRGNVGLRLAAILAGVCGLLGLFFVIRPSPGRRSLLITLSSCVLAVRAVRWAEVFSGVSAGLQDNLLTLAAIELTPPVVILTAAWLMGVESSTKADQDTR